MTLRSEKAGYYIPSFLFLRGKNMIVSKKLWKLKAENRRERKKAKYWKKMYDQSNIDWKKDIENINKTHSKQITRLSAINELESQRNLDKSKLLDRKIRKHDNAILTTLEFIHEIELEYFDGAKAQDMSLKYASIAKTKATELNNISGRFEKFVKKNQGDEPVKIEDLRTLVRGK